MNEAEQCATGFSSALNRQRDRAGAIHGAARDQMESVLGTAGAIGKSAECGALKRPKEPPREAVGPAALAMAAQAWCVAGTSRMEMQPELAFEFARILERETRVPRLGCATTRELLDELRARSDLDYRTWQP